MKKKRRSKTDDFDDAASIASESTTTPSRKSRRDADIKDPVGDSRDQSVDDAFESAEEASSARTSDDKMGDDRTEKEESFLAERPDMPRQTAMEIPMAIDGVSGLPPKDKTEGPTEQPSQKDVGLTIGIAPRESTSESRRQLPNPESPETRRISNLRTADLPASPALGSSPTAVPIRFGRMPVSPGTPRGSVSSPVASPDSPLATPRTRQNRPRSTEFRSSKEFRPLYLVQKTKAEQEPVREVDEDLPSLPSSRTSSAHPSMEDLRGYAKAAEAEDYYPEHGKIEDAFRERGRRHSYSQWDAEQQRRHSPDYLDSRSATPVPGDGQRLQETDSRQEPLPRERKERKYEFHSPSELLQRSCYGR